MDFKGTRNHSRYLGDIMASEIDVDSAFKRFDPSPEMLTYVNPGMHKKITRALARRGRYELAKELAEANAVWIIQDGSVDLTQVDNYFHGPRYVNKFGELKFAFLSLETKSLCGADDQWKYLQESLVSLYPNSGFITRENVVDMLLQKHAITEENLDEQKEESDCFEPVDWSDAPF